MIRTFHSDSKRTSNEETNAALSVRSAVCLSELPQAKAVLSRKETLTLGLQFTPVVFRVSACVVFHAIRVQTFLDGETYG